MEKLFNKKVIVGLLFVVGLNHSSIKALIASTTGQLSSLFDGNNEFERRFSILLAVDKINPIATLIQVGDRVGSLRLALTSFLDAKSDEARSFKVD